MAKAKAKLVRQMTRKDFEGIKLDRDQKKSLVSMVDAKYSEMVQLDSKIAKSIPADQVKALKKAFRNAEKDGSSEVEAMSVSMEAIGLPEMVQEKVLMMNNSKEEIREAIRMSIVKTFDQEQQEAFAVVMATKKEMMGEEMSDKEMSDKEEMADKEMMDEKMEGKEMSDEKEMTGEKEMMDEKVVTAE